MQKSYFIHASFQKCLGNLLNERNVKSVFLVRGHISFEKCGAEREIIPLLEDKHIRTTLFSDFSNNPKEEDVSRGISLFLSSKYDMIISIGGGSVIDMAKLIRYYSYQESGNSTSLIAIPTTAGSGAESTNFSVCYENGIKNSIEADDMIADLVILYPPFTYSNDLYLTACTGFDALAQAIESLWSIHANEASEGFSMRAIGNLFCPLQKICFEKSECSKERDSLLLGANLAGKAINITHTTAPHAMSYVLTSKYHYPHGHAVALTFPFFFEKNLTCSEKDFSGYDYPSFIRRIGRLKKMLNLDETANLFKFMKSYVNKIGLNYDIQRPFDQRMLMEGINVDRANNNPLRLSREIIREAVNSIYKI